MAILARGAADLKAARELLAKDGIEVHDYVCDVSKASDIAKAHEKITADLGPVDILVNNAGTARTMAFENILTRPGRKTSTSSCLPRSVSPGWSGRA